MTETKIIFLNGVGSVGKTSIAKALQEILQQPYLHVGIDQFLEMLPEKYIDIPEGIYFETNVEDACPVVRVKSGKIGMMLLRGMRHAIAALAQQGNNLIIDEVLISDEMQEYATLLAPFTVFYVGVVAPLPVIEERERMRGDRLIGLARGQYDSVHQGKVYDMTVDTATLSPLECARLIKNRFKL